MNPDSEKDGREHEMEDTGYQTHTCLVNQSVATVETIPSVETTGDTKEDQTTSSKRRNPENLWSNENISTSTATLEVDICIVRES